MKPSDHLRAAKALLTEETWGKGSAAMAVNKLCAGIALIRAPHESYQGFYFFQDVIGGRMVTIQVWNDAPERTLTQVREAFDAAIVLAERDEAGLDSLPHAG